MDRANILEWNSTPEDHHPTAECTAAAMGVVNQAGADSRLMTLAYCRYWGFHRVGDSYLSHSRSLRRLCSLIWLYGDVVPQEF